MRAKTTTRPKQGRRPRDDALKPGSQSRGSQDQGQDHDHDQGIVRDERGQEQPADKERAQRVSKSE
jgi:hypothetical protein